MTIYESGWGKDEYDEWVHQIKFREVTSIRGFSVCAHPNWVRAIGGWSGAAKCGHRVDKQLAHTGYSFIMLNGRPINWLDSKGRNCWHKAKISDGICIEGDNVYYTGVRGNRCKLNKSGGTDKGPRGGQPQIARLGVLIKEQ